MGITGQEHAEFPHMTNQQRMSMYVRRLPEIVKQQLLPHLQRSVSAAARQTTPHVGPGTSPSTTTTTTTTTSSSSKQPVGQGENTSGGLSYPGEEAERDDRLPRTLTTEEVNQTLHVLQMASHGFPASSYGSTHHKPSRSPSQMMMTGPADSHTREPSHSHSVQVQHHPHSQHSQHHQHSQQQHGIPPTSHPHPHPHHQHVSVGAAAAAAGVVSGEEAGGHDAPNWSRTKSTTVLLTCTALYAIIAEILVSVVDVVLDGNKNLPEKFLGISLFALVPNTTEFMNAISFAINGNIALRYITLFLLS
jgi:Ca2+:H+ antiporter